MYVFALVVALGRVDIRFVCRRLRKSKEDLESDLRRMRSILKISDTAIEAYHLSLHDFLQDRDRAGNEEPLTLALIAGGGVVIWIIIGVLVFKGVTLAAWIVVIAVLTTAYFIWIFNRDRIEKALARGIRKRNTDAAV